LDLFNEIVLSATLYCKILYSDLVDYEDDKIMYAKMGSGFILFYCFINMIVIVQAIYHKNKKKFIYYYNNGNDKYNKWLNKRKF
jgi:hypothetical protein